MSLQIIEATEILILGDFNIVVNDPTDLDAQLLLAWLESNNLNNIVDFPTHRSGNMLDLVIVRENQRMSVTNIGPGDYISDHCEVSYRLNILKPSYTRVTKEFRSVKNLDIQEMGNDIDTMLEQIISSDDIEELSIRYQEGLDSLVEKFMSLKKSVVTIRHKYPWFSAWFSEEILHLKKALRSLEKRWSKDKTTENWTEYKNLRNIYNHRLRAVKRFKLSKMINECGNNIGQLYRIIDSVMGRNKDNPMPGNISTEELTEKFADFFLDKNVRLRNELSEVDLYEPLQRDIKIQLKEFVPVGREELMKYMIKLGSKKCDLDPIPVNIYKQLIDKLVAITTHIVNTSLQSRVPERWKEAPVKPLIKKPTLSCEYKNYRPVGNLCVISKIIEKAALKQIILHLDENARLPSFQSTYRAFHSTETALVDLIGNLLWNFEKQELCVVAIIDLLAAFNTVDHNLLRSILNE